ncbi:NarK family nitrate/nitrite MFS transporter [Chroococcidiopsis sp. CCMEE 29]|uniref:NarK family nitrate/nitrite MFS transporter n=1 Tax=Chroococcidiopsis sp. CCMEE 29 TaxID=155894 RepID=UPI0020212C10|nr:NarK family nitrate/nitrite MFS transporter [Chroococcidiopsis sp. CCMEE 29]
MLRQLWSFRGRYRILHLTWIAFLLSFVVLFNFAPLATAIQEEFQLSADQYRTMILCNLALAIPFRIIFGMLIDRVGPRIVFSAILIYSAIPCMLFALAQDFNQLAWSRLALGIVAAGFVIGIRMVAEWFPPREIGFAEGIYGGWGNFGSGVAAFTLPLVASASSFLVGGQVNWRFAVALTGIIAAVYGVIYFFSVQDTPPGKEYQRPERDGGLEVTTQKDFWLLCITNFPIFAALGVVAWRFSTVNLLNQTGLVITLLALLSVYLFQTYMCWNVNRELMTGQKRYPPEDRYKFKQVALLELAYFVCFGSELAVVSMIPAFYAQNFKLNPAMAGAIASSYAFMNLVARPGGGLISDTVGSRKWTLVVLLGCTGIGYLLMSGINGNWSLPLAIFMTMVASFCVMAAEGATYGIVPLVKKRITGQIAGNVGAHGNVGGVAFLTLYSLVPEGSAGNQIFFSTIGISSLIVTFLCCFFLMETEGSHEDEEIRLASPSVPTIGNKQR